MEEDFKGLQKENELLRDKIEAIFDDFNMDVSRKDLWKLINQLISNEIEQEELCGDSRKIN